MSSSGIASIFKRGGQKQEQHGAPGAGEEGDAAAAEDSSRKLEQHLQQLSVAWAAPKSKKGLAAAVWRPSVGAFEVVERGRQAFHGQGFNFNKKLHLNVEEAVFLMDRAVTILLIDQQQQQQQQPQQQQRLLSMQEALHMMAVVRVSADRLSVLSYLSRLGFTVRRHPAVWQVPPDVAPCSIWQRNPAWAHTDGLPLRSVTQQPAAAAAAGGGRRGSPAAVAQPSNAAQQQGATSQQPQPQGKEGSPAATEQPPKRRKVQQQPEQQQPQDQQQQQQSNGGDQPQQQEQQQEQQPPSTRQWYPCLPNWLQQPIHHHQQQQQPVSAAVPPLLGVQLQQQFPLLRPLRRYRDTVNTVAPQSVGGDGSGTQQQQQHAGGSDVVSDVVFDVLINTQHFSYKAPPAPQFSIAMMHSGCSNLPPLDELMDKSLAVAGGAAALAVAAVAGGAAVEPHSAAAAAGDGALAAGDSEQQQLPAYQPVKFALPEEGDVGFCELMPLRLLNLLTNQSQ